MNTPLLDRPTVDIGTDLETFEVKEPDPDDRVIVLVHTGHSNPKLATVELVYRWHGPETLAVGDLVQLPKMPRMGAHDGIVVSLDGASHPYQGPCRFIVRKLS